MILSPAIAAMMRNASGDVIILLDDCRPQSPAAKVLRRRQGCLIEVRMFKQPHGSAMAFAYQRPACNSPFSMPNSNRETGFKDARRRLSAVGFFPISSPIAPSIARTLGGSEAAIFSMRSKRPRSRNSATVRRAASFGDNSLVFPPRRRKSSSAASTSERPVFRPPRVDHRVFAKKLSRQAEPTGRNFAATCRLRRETQRVGGCDSGGKHGLVPGGEPLHDSRVGQALAQCGLAGTIVNTLAQSFQLALTRQTGECLRYRRNRGVTKVVEPPEAFAAAFDPLADPFRDLPRVCRGCDVLTHDSQYVRDES